MKTIGPTANRHWAKWLKDRLLGHHRTRPTILEVELADEIDKLQYGSTEVERLRAVIEHVPIICPLCECKAEWSWEKWAWRCEPDGCSVAGWGREDAGH